jgi:hypothetical protein
VSIQAIGHVHKNRGPHSDENVRTQTGGSLTILALEADQASKNERCSQTERGVSQRGQIDVLDRLQGHGA